MLFEPVVKIRFSIDSYESFVTFVGFYPSLGEVIYESGKQMKQVFFPTTSIVSWLYLMTNGATAEIGVVGFEGMLGVTIFLGEWGK